MANMGAQVNGAYDLCDIVGFTWEEYDHMTEGAMEALEELYDKLTVFDPQYCNRHWNLDIDEDATNALVEKYADRIFDEDGNVRTK